MAKGRGRALPTRPDAVWGELHDHEREAVATFTESLGVPTAAWLHLEETLDLVLSVACARRLERYVEIEGLTKSEAWARTAETFGLSTGAVKQADYRRQERALSARRAHRQEESHSRVTDTAPRSA